MTLGEFARLCGGDLAGAPASQVFQGFATDNREVQRGNLFLAIRGANVDGHDFVPSAIAAGAAASLVERPVPGPYILVPNLVAALAKYAGARRATFDGPVIGVTGSNGKTTAKEFAAAAMAELGPVLKNAGNRNSEYTSPLVWADLNRDHRSVVIEMAMRGFGQIAHLAAFVQPNIGIVTNVGTAHIEMVGSRAGIARAKGELLEALPTNGAAALWQEDDYLSDLKEAATCAVRTFGFSPDAECRVLGYRALDWGRSMIRGTLDGTSFECELPALGRHQALNAAAAILAAHSAGVGVAEAAGRMAQAELPPMRMEAVRIGEATVLLDAYNASPDSTVAALNALREAPCSGRRVVVLGEMRELGSFEEKGHKMVGRALAVSDVDEVLLTGGATRFIAEEALLTGLPPERLHQMETLDLGAVTEFLRGLKPGDVALIKGSRALALEKALEPLREDR